MSHQESGPHNYVHKKMHEQLLEKAAPKKVRVKLVAKPPLPGMQLTANDVMVRAIVIAEDGTEKEVPIENCISAVFVCHARDKPYLNLIVRPAEIDIECEAEVETPK